MALRIATLEQRAPELSADEAKARLQRASAALSRAIGAGDLAAVGAIFDDVAGWQQAQRRFQAQRDLARLAMTAAQGGMPWQQLFAEVARHLLAALEQEPAEPVLLNELGVLLFELGESSVAAGLFRAAQRLDPELPHVTGNLAAAKARVKQRQIPLAPALAPSVRAIGARARSVSARAKPASGLTLSLCMIVRDEEEMLPGCLEAAREAVDEIVVVDTGSTDRTVEIARSFGARVIEFPWNGSFSDARNVSLEAATGDWIVYLDADEHLVPEDARALRCVLGRTWREAFYLVETNYIGGEEAGSAVTHLALRVFRNRPEYRFEGRIHEQKTRRMPTYLAERFEATSVRVRHYGYLHSVQTARDKSRRNIELLKAERRDGVTPFNSFNLASEHLALGDVDRARELFDESWKLLARQPDWELIGYAPLLLARAVRARREAGDTAAALDGVEEGLQVFPDHTDLVFEAALCARADGDGSKARLLAEECLRMGDAPAKYAATVGSGTYLALNLLADLDLEAGDRAGAVARLRRSLAEHPEFTRPVLPLATELIADGAPGDEVEAELPAERPSVLLLLAAALYEAGRAEEAEQRFRRVLERQPTNSVARIGLVEALLSQRRFQDAAGEAAAEPHDSPLAPLAAAEELFAHAARGDGAALEAALEGAEARGATAADLAVYRAWHARLTGGQLVEALAAEAAPSLETVLEALLRVQEFDAFAVVHGIYQGLELAPRERAERLARMYLRRGYVESAAEEWITVCRQRPDVRALVGLAQVAWAQGMHDDARALAEDAIALDPDDAEAQRLAAGLAARRAA